MSNIDKQALRERYSPKPVPKCHICGEEMTIQRMSASRITYGCTGEGDDGYFKFGRTFVDEHYEKSRVTVVDVSDPDVLALLDELDSANGYASAYEAEKWHYHGLAESEGERADRAEKRVAELERSETQLINERDDAESALNDAYKAVMGQAPEWSNWFSFGNAIDEIELACELWRNQTDDVIQFRQRIAELEAREVNLSKLSVGEVMHMSGFSRDYAEGWCAGNDNAIHEIRTAGIKVKGE
ncbi:ead/Ea22-like family protein [Salmonella enterica]|uniref:Ead/Ea22-like family protein n=2 Tax=Salmonella enterica TaxID=28901 RepID=A0A5Z9CB81_SALET|nr:ead/Ea22-like family protein [Salmonella enterica]ECA3444194.1 ead/Ea22-like family protein [Salmonella enterica subsp. enterica serovar Oranienburg]ECT0409017.1 ead/Ea22-like family protein [Salmonella enterica subsp. enterica serovar Braenderup]EAX2143171.1 ead/Ea22-like family protein [Salmonella enterica]EAX2204772.1 ead/Ea22-like family protein [Salmonella enterica]